MEFAPGAVGIEIFVSEKFNMTFIESENCTRFKVEEFDSSTNFAQVIPVEDNMTLGDGLQINKKDLLASELFELKNLWLTYNKKMNQLLMILP